MTHLSILRSWKNCGSRFGIPFYHSSTWWFLKRRVPLTDLTTCIWLLQVASRPGNAIGLCDSYEILNVGEVASVFGIHASVETQPVYDGEYLGGSIHGGTPKWMVSSGKSPSKNGWFRGTPFLGNPHFMDSMNPNGKKNSWEKNGRQGICATGRSGSLCNLYDRRMCPKDQPINCLFSVKKCVCGFWLLYFKTSETHIANESETLWRIQPCCLCYDCMWGVPWMGVPQ